jgi:uncharacterized protein (TIRG00374 family)
MESNPSIVGQVSRSELSSRRILALVRTAIGGSVLVFLYYWGNLDFKALMPLGHAPWTVVLAGMLVLSTLPLLTLRWAIVLRALDVPIALIPLFQITCISTFVSQLLFGPTSADAIRVLYAWRILHRGGGRIAISIVVDRAVGLLALLVLATSLMALRWQRVEQVPELMVLALSLMACVGAGIAAGAVLLMAASLFSWTSPKLQRYHRVRRFLGRVQGVLEAFRRRPMAVGAILVLSLTIQGLTVLAFVIIARSLHIGLVSLLDVSIAAPLAMLANVLPFTPGGLGVGEAAFDQLCRWFAPASGMAAYASIFFAFRAVSMIVMLIPGPISFASHRSG